MSDGKSKLRTAFEAAVVGVETGAAVGIAALAIGVTAVPVAVAASGALTLATTFAVLATAVTAGMNYAPPCFYIPGGRKNIK